MSSIERRLDQLISKELKRTPIPQKTDRGILVGRVLIVNHGHYKDILRDDEILYRNIYLNVSAIAIANIMNRYTVSSEAETIYHIDQDYGKWYIESQRLKKLYEKSVLNRDYDRADILQARYIESRDRAVDAKMRAEFLCDF